MRMSQPRDAAAELERLVHRALREQPPARAPQDLATRVLAQIEARAARPWWRRNPRQWPLAARAALLACGLGVAELLYPLLVGVMRSLGNTRLESALVHALAGVRATGHIAAQLLELGALVVNSLPRGWLYGGLLFTLAMYGVLFGLIAAAYCTLTAATHANGGLRS